MDENYQIAPPKGPASSATEMLPARHRLMLYLARRHRHRSHKIFKKNFTSATSPGRNAGPPLRFKLPSTACSAFNKVHARWKCTVTASVAIKPSLHASIMYAEKGRAALHASWALCHVSPNRRHEARPCFSPHMGVWRATAVFLHALHAACRNDAIPEQALSRVRVEEGVECVR